MPFDVALSGIRAASSNLSVTGNNIANASTTGFKSARAEFGDLYATSVLGAGGNAVGSGVRLENTAQQFTQGNVAFTENEMDMAVSGNGLFVVKRNGEQFYTRAGAFSIDKDGFIVTSSNARLQGYSADDTGTISGLQNDLKIQTSNQTPRATTKVGTRLNLNSASPILESTGTSFSTKGNAVSVAQMGLQNSTASTVQLPAMTLPIPLDGSTLAFSVNLAGSSTGNGTVNVSVVLSPVNFRGANAITDSTGIRDLAGLIGSQLTAPQAPETPIELTAQGDNSQLTFTARNKGEPSIITITGSPVSTPNTAKFGIPLAGNSVTIAPGGLGTAAVSNGYPAQSLDITDSKGKSKTFLSLAGASAASTASKMSALGGVTATATTDVRIVSRAAGNPNSANLMVKINGVNLTGQPLTTLADGINSLTSSTLPGITAKVDPATGDLLIHSAVGDDIKLSITSTTATDTLEVLGNPDSSSVILNANDPVANATVVGGSIDLVLAEGYTASNPTPPSIGLFGPLSGAALTSVTLNQFNAADSHTYNDQPTSMKVFDSLGNAHVLNQYFVKQKYDPTDPTTQPNHWKMYAKIDGRDVGDPDTTLPPPQNTLPTQASFNVFFNQDGSLNTLLSDRMLISNWTPLDPNGNPNGSLGPVNVLAGGDVNVGVTPTSSNMLISLEGTTQFGSAYSVNDVNQDGYTTGRLSGLNVNQNGIIFARFTNGESKALGQIVLADFANNQGLQPVGDSMWAENFASGPPNIGTPTTAALGALQSGALEASNVDLSAELVNLIIAQRDFQASAKIIETDNQVTQTIINLR